jgi:hypothetical protein
MDRCGLELTSDSPQIKITGRYYNRSSHAMVWIGLFKSNNPVLSSENAMLKYSAEVILKITKLAEHDNHIKLTIHPGTSHFVQISGSESGIKGSAFRDLENSELHTRSRNGLVLFSEPH